MAGSINKVILVGNLGADPEIRRLGSGDPVVNLRLATSETWRDKQTGERKEKTEWHNIVIFNDNLAKVAEQYLKKGAKIYLEGSLQTRKWHDQSGTDRYTTEVVLQKFHGELQILDSRSESNNRSFDNDRVRQTRDHSYSGSSSSEHANPALESSDFSRNLDDEIPF